MARRLTQPLDATLAAWARPDNAALAPWLAPYRAAARCIAASHVAGQPLARTLDHALSHWPLRDALCLRAGRLRFVPQHELPTGEAYEAFIARSACVPTRDNPHDLCNALVWLTFPAVKRRLNELQSAQITAAGIGPTRGALRDALTLFDESAAWWPAPQVLADALRRRDWHGLFITHRAAWQQTRPTLFGHALIEKLLHPRKPITAHVWLLPESSDAQTSLLDMLTPALLAQKTRLPLPVLGVPGWWAANEEPGFYDDAGVFRPRAPIIAA